MKKKLTLAAAVLALSAAGLAGCAEAGSPAAEPTQAAAEQAASLAVSGAWAKAAEADGMTGAFGTLENTGVEDITVVAASSPSAGMVELHEMAMGADGAMTMQEIEGGFTVPAGGEYVLEPGGSHLMLMQLEAGLLAGDTVDITLELADGSTLDVQATAKDFAGANETYAPETGHGDAGHGDAGHTDDGHTHGAGETHGTAEN
ncbi:copper chaperone PCu(A)C [Arthrobacter caoxuetaonis]|uniref:copper chaperone PCu(A)C n=1 Tax=Arthrobacter caoxuetaonis TaxID=2886935 RepID=UPI001D13C980|nr:copper chaperone PCu(A)C [Arthrobacter caoxuetaonis]MCC3281328.1 copper chaperone PCu(A)C [Arthrobacter caoxuetaonis]